MRRLFLNWRPVRRRRRYRESELRRLAESFPVMMYRKSLADDRFEYVSSGSIDLCGHSPEEFYDTPALMASVVHPDWQEHFQKQWSLLLQGEIPPLFEFQIVHKSGETKWVCQRNILARDGADNLIAIEGIIIDISEHKRAEETLRQRERWYRALVETFTEVFGLTDENGVILDRSPTQQTILGSEVAEDLAKSIFDYFHTEDIPGARRRFEQLLKAPGTTQRDEYALPRRDGSRLWIECTCSNYLHEPAIRGIVFSFRDIRKRKRAEEALKESEQKYLVLFDNMAVGAFLMSEVFLDCNEQACRLFAATRTDIVGCSMADFSPAFQPDGRPSSEVAGERINAALAGTPQQFYWQHRRKDRTLIDTEVTFKALRIHEQQVILATIHETTRQKRAEEALRTLSGRLLQVQDDERRRIARELHDTTAQWLAALDMNLSALNNSVGDANPETWKLISGSRKIVDECSQEVRTLSYLLHPPLLDEHGLLGALEEYADGFAKRSGIHVSLDLAPDAGRLSKEIELALFRVLQESLANVHRHSRSSTATVRLVKESDEITLEVIDTGHGMNLPSAEGAVRETLRRVGVGIAGMKERLRQLGGQLQIESSSAGTVVRAKVPCRTDNL